MAGSRLEKIGTIFSRTTGLLRSGVLKEEDKPLWYNVYKAFPPKLEPRYDRPKSTREIANIFYPEDAIRAKFYKAFGSPGIIDMANTQGKSISQKFIDRYNSVQKQDPSLNEDAAFQTTAESLIAEGIPLAWQKEAEEDPVKVEGRRLSHIPIISKIQEKVDLKKTKNAP